ncbi:MAG: DUF6867 family protein [Hyphomicrobiaceae bacterium]|nr:hypothetical protein [Hyphomicrobiaceae bacterium]
MPDFLYSAGPYGLWIFLLVTVVMGGGAAFMAGKAIAETWRPRLHLFVYAILLAATVRFIHFALFEEPLLSLRSFLVDLVVVTCLTLLGFSITRQGQMASQYRWDKATNRA